MEPELDANSEIDSTLVASSGTSNSNSAYTKSSDNSPTILDNGMELTSKIHILEKMNKKVRTELEEIYSYRMTSPQSHDNSPCGGILVTAYFFNMIYMHIQSLNRFILENHRVIIF